MSKFTEMPKQVRHDKDVILNSFQNPFLKLDIHLTFAFPPQTKAELLKFCYDLLSYFIDGHFLII